MTRTWAVVNLTPVSGMAWIVEKADNEIGAKNIAIDIKEEDAHLICKVMNAYFRGEFVAKDRLEIGNLAEKLLKIARQ